MIRSRKSSLVDSANYFGANQIVNVGSQQAHWLMAGGEPHHHANHTGVEPGRTERRPSAGDSEVSFFPDPEKGGIHGPSKMKSTLENVSLFGFGLPFLIVIVIGGMIALFISVAAVIVAIHRIHEGHVGLYFKNGALMDSVSDPGIHWLQPFVTDVVEVRVTPETKTMDPLVCTTRDGVRNVFRDVQVITSIDRTAVLDLVRRFTPNLKQILVYDRVRQAVQDFCSNHSIDEVYNTRFLDMVGYVETNVKSSIERFVPTSANSIILWNVFLPKPDVPPAIAANYRQVKVEWTEQLVAKQKQITEQILKETEKLKALSDAERQKAVQAIHISQMIEEEEGKANITQIENRIFEEKEKLHADVSSYVAASDAKSNEGLLTDNYVKLETAKMMLNNTKMFFSGSDSVIGGLLTQVFNGNKG